MPLGIDDLVTPVTADDVLASMLSVASSLGLSTTSWQSGQPSHTILRIMASAIASTLSIVSTITRGGLLDYAASVTPEGGPGWLDVLVESGWSDTRRAATYATTDVTLTTSAACPGGTYAPGAFHVSRGSIGYSNAATLIVPAGAGSVTGSFRADVAGSSGSSGVGTITTVVTTIVGVTCTNSAAALGADAETNAELVTRMKLKWQSISVDGPAGAYVYNAMTINGKNQVQVTSGALTQPDRPVTRATTVTSASTGVVTTYIAHAGGAYATPPNYTGNVAKSIASSTNASPIVVTMAAAHGYATNDTVYIKGHLVNTAANGSWTITVTGATTYSLNSSVGNGVGGATGSAYRYSDLDLIDNSIQANAVPLTVTASTVSATATSVTVVGVITVTGSAANRTDADLVAAASTAVSDLCATIPIGGIGTSTYVYVDTIRAAIRDALGGITLVPNVVLSSPAADVAVPANGVATVTVAPSFTIARV